MGRPKKKRIYPNLLNYQKYLERLRKKEELGLQVEDVVAQIYREHNYTLPVSKSTVENSSTVSNNDPSTLPPVSSIATSPVILNSGPETLSTISETNCSSLPIVSSTVSSSTSSVISKNHPTSILPEVFNAAEKTTPMQRVVRIRRRTVSTQIKVRQTESRPFPREISISGRRIIDFRYFFKALKVANNHSEDGCDLSNMVITQEEISGIFTSFTLKCVTCNFETEICSENPYKIRNVNTDFVSGILGIQGSFKSSAILLSKTHLPMLKQVDFIQECENIVYSRINRNKKKLRPEYFKNFTKKYREPQLTGTITQDCSSASDNSNIFEQDNFGDLLAEEQFEITEENEFEVSIPKIPTSAERITTTQRVLRPRCRTVSTQTNFENQKPRSRPFQGESSINSRIIIEFQHFFKALKDLNDHSGTDCNLNNMIILKEETNGICTSVTLTCVRCKFEKAISSESPNNTSNLNTDFVSGILGMKGTFQDSITLLTELNLPILTHEDFIQQCKIIYYSMTFINSIKHLQNTSNNLLKTECGESTLTTMEQSFYAAENIEKEPQLTTTKQECSSASDGSDLFEQVDLGSLLVEEQIEIKKEIVSDSENEFETSIPNQTAKTSDNKLIAGQKQVILNMTTIKQEINSDDEST